MYSININPTLEEEDFTAMVGTLEFMENKQVSLQQKVSY